MRTIEEIYNMYDVMPQLRQHMFRVAAVGEMIADHIDEEVNKETLVSALLLHDIGNIIKFKLEAFPEFLEPQGLVYWQEVQKNAIEKYGNNEDKAHIAIARELGMPESIITIISGMAFVNLCAVCDDKDWMHKICKYADLRVAPHGVYSLDDRLEDFRIRYNITAQEENPELLACAYKLEEQIFSRCSIKPQDITDASILEYMLKYEQYSL